MNSSENIKTHVAGVLEGLRLAGVSNLSSLRQAVSVFNLPSSVRLSLLANLAVDLSEVPEAEIQAPPILPANVSRNSLSPIKGDSSPSSAFKRPASSSSSTAASTSTSASTSSYAAGAASRHLPAIFNAHAVDSTYHYFDERKRSPPKGITSSSEPILSPAVASLRIALSPAASSASPGRMALLERARREAARLVAQRQMDGDDLRNDAVTPGSSLRPTSSPSERIHAVIQAGAGVSSTPSYSLSSSSSSLSSSAAEPTSTITPLKAPDFTSVENVHHHPAHTQTESTQTETTSETTHAEDTMRKETTASMSHNIEQPNVVAPEPVVTAPEPARYSSSSSLSSDAIQSISSSNSSSHSESMHPVVNLATAENAPSTEPVSSPPVEPIVVSAETASNETATSAVEGAVVHSMDPPIPPSTPPELPVPAPTPESERETITVPIVQTLPSSVMPEEALSSVVGVTELEVPANEPASAQSQEGMALPASESQAPTSPTPTVASSGRSSPSKSGYLNILEVNNEPSSVESTKTTANSSSSITSVVTDGSNAASTSEPQKEPTPLQKAKLNSVASKFGGAVGAASTNPAPGPRPAIGARPAIGGPVSSGGGVKPSMGFGNASAEAEKRAKAEKEAKKAAEEKKLAEVKARQDKEKADKAEKERIESERKAKVAADKVAAEKAAAEKAAAQKEAMYKAAVEKAKLAALEKKGLTPEQARAQLAATTAKEEAEKKAKADKEAAAVASAAEAAASAVVIAESTPSALVQETVAAEAPKPPVAPASTPAPAPEAPKPPVAPAPASAPAREATAAADSKAPSVSASVAGSVVSTAENLATTMQISDHGPSFWYKHMSRNEMKTEANRRGLDVKAIEDQAGDGKGAKTKALRAALKSDDAAKGHDAYDSFSRDLLLATMSHRSLTIDESATVEGFKTSLRKHDEDNSHKEAQVIDEHHE